MGGGSVTPDQLALMRQARVIVACEDQIVALSQDNARLAARVKELEASAEKPARAPRAKKAQ